MSVHPLIINAQLQQQDYKSLAHVTVKFILKNLLTVTLTRLIQLWSKLLKICLLYMLTHFLWFVFSMLSDVDIIQNTCPLWLLLNIAVYQTLRKRKFMKTGKIDVNWWIYKYLTSLGMFRWVAKTYSALNVYLATQFKCMVATVRLCTCKILQFTLEEI